MKSKWPEVSVHIIEVQIIVILVFLGPNKLSLLWTYSTDQKKPNRERLTERVLFPFHIRSRSRSVSVPYPFCIRSVSVLYPFRSRSVLFCSRSVSFPSVSVLGTRSKERGFRELVYKISDTPLHFIKWVKTVAFMRE